MEEIIFEIILQNPGKSYLQMISMHLASDYSFIGTLQVYISNIVNSIHQSELKFSLT